jgi:hypothetical protein
MRDEAVADRAECVDRFPDAACRQGGEPGADDLVQHLDRTAFGMCTHDRQRPPHRNLLVAAQVYERARGRGTRALRSLQREHELIAREALVRQDFGALFEDRAAVGSRHDILMGAH